MTINTQQTGTNEINSIPLGAKLQSAREAQRLDRKDAAAKLRLNESVIDMIESNSFPDSMPPIFVRGYIRAYGKLLDIPEEEIASGLEPIKPKANPILAADTPVTASAIEPKALKAQYFMKGATLVVTLTLVSLVGAWWHTRANAPQPEVVALAVPAETTPETIEPASTSPGISVLLPTAARTNTAFNALPAPAISADIPAGKIAAFPAAANAHLEAAAKPELIAPEKTKVAEAAVPAYKRAAMADAARKTTVENDIEENEVE